MVNGRHNDEIIKALDTPGDTAYQPCVEAVAEGPTRSSVSYFPDWRSSAVYPNTVRDLWIVCPDELAGAASPALLVFNDGNRYLDAEGPVRAQRVLDAVNADGTVGPIVGVFVTPGRDEYARSGQRRAPEHVAVGNEQRPKGFAAAQHRI